MQGNADLGLPTKKQDDTCTIMYTSGTTGDPKGVILTNKAFVAEVLTYEHLFQETDKVVNSSYSDQKNFYVLILPAIKIGQRKNSAPPLNNGLFWQ